MPVSGVGTHNTNFRDITFISFLYLYSLNVSVLYFNVLNHKSSSRLEFHDALCTHLTKPGSRFFGWFFVRIAVTAVNSCRKCGDCGECGEKIISLLFTAFLTNILRKIQRFSLKNSPHSFSNVYLNSQEIW